MRSDEWQRRKREIEGRAFSGRKPDIGPWDVWCQRFGIDPNTPDERILDDYLHDRIPMPPPRRAGHSRLEARDGRITRVEGFGIPPMWRDEAQRALYASWDAYDAGVELMSPLRQRAQAKAEAYELERWWTL